MDVLGSSEKGVIVCLTFDELRVLTGIRTSFGGSDMTRMVRDQQVSIEGKLKIIDVLTNNAESIARYARYMKTEVDQINVELDKFVPLVAAVLKGEEPAPELLPPASPPIRRIMRNRAGHVRTSAMTDMVLNYCRKVDGVKKT